MTIGVYNNQFTPETKIYILKGVECDAMNNTYWGVYESKEEQLQFFLNNFDYKVFNDFTYQRANGVVNIEGDFDEIRKYNYMIYKNRKAGAGSKWIYCFITQVGYVSDSVCSISFETDVMQTWRFEIEESFLPSYIAYEHRDRWYNSNGNLLPCVNTQPENIELGTEMICGNVVDIFPIANQINFIVITMTSGFNDSEWANFEQGVPTVLRTYIFPFTGPKGVLTDIQIQSTAGGNPANITNFNTIYTAIRNDTNLVNKCVSIKVCNSLVGIKYVNNQVLFTDSMYHYAEESSYKFLIPSTSSFLSTVSDDCEYSNNIDLLRYFNIKRNNVVYEKESKLFCYPFSFTVMTNFNGTYKTYKNEIWEDPQDVSFVAIGTVGSSKSNYIPLNYKVNNTGVGNILDGMSDSFEDGYEMSLPIVSDYTAVLLQSSQNSMNVGVSNTIRNTETANTIASMTGNAMTQQGQIQNNMRLAVTSNNVQLNKDLTDIAMENSVFGFMLNAGGNYMGMLTNPITYTGYGALATGAGAIGSTAMQGGSMLLNVNQAQQNLDANIRNMWQNVGDTNKANNASIAVMNQLRNATTRYQGQTNIQNAIDSYRARINDAKATADTLVSGSNDVYRMLSLNLLTPKLMFFVPTEEYKNRAKLSFTIRGYATNLVELPNLHTRKSWNYIQTVKCNIVSHDIDVVDLERIKQCFDNGITLWHTKDIANYTINNDELTDPTQVDKYGSILSHKKGV